MQLDFTTLASALLCISTVTTENGLHIPASPTTSLYPFIDSFIAEYKNYAILIHVDNANKRILHTVFSLYRTASASMTVYNHETSCDHLGRPTPGRILHMVFINNLSTFTSYSGLNDNILPADRLVYFIKNASLLPTDFQPWEVPNMDKVTDVIVVNLQRYVDIFLVCNFCGVYSKKLFLIKSSASDRRFLLTELNFRTRLHYYGNTFRFAFLNVYPYVYCSRQGSMVEGNAKVTVCEEADGVEYELLDTLSSRMNFTYRLEFVGDVTNISDGQAINILATGQYDALIGGITLTARRYSMLYFTRTLIYENVVFIFRNEIPESELYFGLFGTFTSGVWVTIVAVVLLMALCHCICATALSGRNKGYMKSLWIIAMHIVEQATARPRLNIYSIIVLLVTWFLACIIFGTSYKSKLTSRLLNPPQRKISTIEELLNEDYEIVLDLTYTGMFLEVFDSNMGDLHRAKKSLVFRKSLCDAIDYSLTHRAAIFGEYTQLYYTSYYSCPQFRDFHKKYEVLKYPVIEIAIAWAFRNGASFWKGFDKEIIRLRDTGLFSKWMKDIFSERTRVVSNDMKTSQTASISLQAVASVFTLYFIGITISILCFITETIHHLVKVNWGQFSYPGFITSNHLEPTY